MIINLKYYIGYNYLGHFGTTDGNLGLISDYNKDGFNIGKFYYVFMIDYI